MPLPRALIADGDPSTRLFLSSHLRTDGFSPDECGDGRDAFERLTASPFDLVILDARLPRLDGIALCRAIRQEAANRDAGVFVLGTSAAESDKVLALVNGADDYLTKPISIREFLARVCAVMRRAARTSGAARERIQRGDLDLDPSRRQLIVRGRAIACSRQEFDLVYVLAAAPGIVFTREELLARHWPAFAASRLRRGKPGIDEVSAGKPGVDDASADKPRDADIRLVDPIVSRVRRKIERNPDDPEMIVTVWGVGYKFRS